MQQRLAKRLHWQSRNPLSALMSCSSLLSFLSLLLSLCRQCCFRCIVSVSSLLFLLSPLLFALVLLPLPPNPESNSETTIAISRISPAHTPAVTKSASIADTFGSRSIEHFVRAAFTSVAAEARCSIDCSCCA